MKILKNVILIKQKLNFCQKKENEINKFLEKIKIFGNIEVIKEDDTKFFFPFQRRKKLYFK